MGRKVMGGGGGRGEMLLTQVFFPLSQTENMAKHEQ